MITLQQISEKIKSKGKYWIVFTGDSITSCEWVHPNWREIVEYVLKDKLDYDWGIKTFNFAYDGATTEDLLERFDEFLLLKPDLIICMIGANDPFHPVPIDKYKENISNIIKKAKESETEFILSTDNKPANPWAANEYKKYVDELVDLDINNFINLFDESSNFPSEKIYTFVAESDIPSERVKKGEQDFWHPNQLGNAYIAEVILKEVFGVGFDSERYWQDTLAGKKLPRY